ncbi:MAG TPA: hypothetical protein PLO43_03515, partial [Chlamydiales bacterium]|nr:hypothetical protein [Chlamydiales bacterium]
MNKLLLSLSFLLCSCGYHFPSASHSIAVPYVKGDTSGLLTDFLVRELEMRGWMDYSGAAAYTLDAKIVREDREPIGFRYDRKGTSDNRISRLRPTESKCTVTVEVVLRNENTGEIVFGPQKVKADIDYDYVNFDTISDLAFTPAPGAPLVPVLAFSL